MSEKERDPLHFYMDTDILMKALDACDLGDGYMAKVRMYPHKDMLPELTSVVEYSIVERLEARIQKLRDAAERLGKAVSMGNREQVICASIELREALKADDEASK